MGRKGNREIKRITLERVHRVGKQEKINKIQHELADNEREL